MHIKLNKFKPYMLLAITAALIALSITATLAGPQHWGSGYPYLIAIRQIDKSADMLQAYELPLRAKDATWITRWTDRKGLKGCAAQFAATGDFWPKNFGTEYLAAIIPNPNGASVWIFEAPQVFGTYSWKLVNKAKLQFPKNLQNARIIGSTTGDLLKIKRDQIIITAQTNAGINIVAFIPPDNPKASEWQSDGNIYRLPKINGEFAGIACGDFWGEKQEYIAIATNIGTKTHVGFYELSRGEIKFLTSDAADIPKIIPTGLIATDWTKDGFDTLTFIPADPKQRCQVRVAPLKPGMTKASLGPVYTGKAMSRQWMPGAGGKSSKITMTGIMPRLSAKKTILTAGRIFGYVNVTPTTSIRKTHKYDPSPDAEIAFTHRIPTYSIFKGEPNYGWPAKGETMGYEIAIKNNGQTTIPAGSAVLRVWINTPYRNADADIRTCDKPNMIIPIKEALPPFDPMNPKYVKIKVTTKWPYDLIPCGPRATWKKVNLEQVGERWLVVDLDCKGDANLRNNRYEAAFHSYTYHPIFREYANLANRIPTVEGDPCSLEYLSRKLADAITCVWERSGTLKNEDVLQRAYFDGYEIGFPDDKKDNEERLEAWRVVQDKYEGWRELDIWWGENQTWEKYDWSYSPELHESGHLFHPLGDLYGLFAFPIWTSAAKMADGTPVQLMTHAWGPDLYSEGYATISWPACEVMKRTIVGSRGAGIERWWTTAPDKLFVRVLDRDGKPVPNAEVTAWKYLDDKPSASGKTGADGRWDLTFVLGKPTLDKIGRKHYYHEPENGLTDALTQIMTVKIGDSYQDCAILGAEDTGAHGRHTLLGRSFTDEQEWTWDFHTNYKAGAPNPSFEIEAAVQGSKVELGISGKAGAKYRLYRRWEPSYVRYVIGDYEAKEPLLKITQDLAEPDSHKGGRFRAIYEVTEIINGTETLPRVVTVVGLKNTNGITTQADGRMLIATNSGIANPFCVLSDGKTYLEYFYHYRFGHTAMKIVQSKLNAGRYYMTLSASDAPGDSPDYRFDIADPLGPGRIAYDVRNEIGWFDAVSNSPTSFTLLSERDAAQIRPGDSIEGDNCAVITQITGRTFTTDRTPFGSSPEQRVRFVANRTAGRPGNNAELRELRNARGLDTILLGDAEYIVIADSGNKRLVVWDDHTSYITQWATESFNPAAVAADPSGQGRFFVIDRHTGGKSKLYLFKFNGKTLAVESGYPVDIEVGDSDNKMEMGLAIAKLADGTITLAITDAERNRVLEFKQTNGNWKLEKEYKKAIGTFAGESELANPTDAAYVVKESVVRLYVVDGNNRVVQVR